MCKFLAAVIFLLAFENSHACGKDEAMNFGEFYGQPSPHVTTRGGKLILDTSFLTGLIKNPNGKSFERDRNELLYLISRNDKKAAHAGVLVLSQLIEHPTIVTECDSDHELYGKEELAFALSRSDHIFTELCALSSARRKKVVELYKSRNVLWSNVDPPWMEGNLSCSP